MNNFHPLVCIIAAFPQIHDKAFIFRATLWSMFVGDMDFNLYLGRCIFRLELDEVLNETLELVAIFFLFISICEFVRYDDKTNTRVSHSFHDVRDCITADEHIQLIPFVRTGVFCERLSYAYIALSGG